MKVDGKSDGSPVTEADLAADRVIAEGLARLAPRVSSLSEERVHLATPPYKESFFLIDPLDGKGVRCRPREFTVNLAIVSHGTPLLGIVGAPALGLIWRGIVGRGAERLTLRDGAPLIEPIHTGPAAARKTLDRRGQPLARRSPHRSLHCARAGAVRPSLAGGQMAGWRRVRSISIPAVIDLRMGRGGRAGRRHAAGGKITDSKGAACISASEPKTSSFGVHRLGRSVGGVLRFGLGMGRNGLTVTLRWREVKESYWRGSVPARPAHLRAVRKRAGSAAKASRFLPAEQIKPLSRHDPESGITRIGHAAPGDRSDRSRRTGDVDFRWATKEARLPSLRKRQTVPASVASNSGIPWTRWNR